jgi:chromosome partitioning protein
MSPPTLSCVNLKGGVGKTALAVNFAAYCGELGKRTLLIDMDPQTNATFSCISYEEWQEHAAKKGTVADLLGARRHTSAEGTERTASSVIRAAVFPGVDLIPSHQDLFTIDLDMAGEPARERKLRKAIKPVLDNYDIIVCDCPPNLTIPTQNSLAISTHFAVPISPDFLSGIGVGLLLNRIEKLADALDVQLTLAGVVISRVGRPAVYRAEIMAALQDQLGDKVLSQRITERAAVGEAAMKRVSVYDSGNQEAAAEFRAVSRNLLQRIGVTP